MSLIAWRDEYALGIADVDHEHRELIELINRVHAEACGGEPEATVDFLGELHAQVSAHFALEEKMMRERRYSRYAEHKDDHERLLDEIRDRMDEYDDGAVPDLEAFARALEDWFSTHFRTRDARLHKRLDVHH